MDIAKFIKEITDKYEERFQSKLFTCKDYIQRIMHKGEERDVIMFVAIFGNRQALLGKIFIDGDLQETEEDDTKILTTSLRAEIKIL